MASLTIAVNVRFRDLDAMGHVNYATYLTYLEEAANSLWAKVLDQCNLLLDPKDIGYVNVRAEIDYRWPAVLGQTLNVEVWVNEIGNTSFTTTYRIEDSASHTVVEAKTVQVVTFKDAQQKAMPPQIRAALSAYSLE